MGINYKELDKVRELVGKNEQGVYHLLFGSIGYIGSSIDLRKGINGHLSKLRRKTHGNDILQEAYDEYGMPEIKILFKNNLVTENDIRVIEGNLSEGVDITLNRYRHFYCKENISKFNKK
jgi:hypothetical protein